MRLIQIDPSTKTVAYIENEGNLNALLKAIDCRYIDVCARQPNGDALTVDDEALFLEPQPAAFTFNGFGPIHGIGILTGTDEEGETTPPTMTLDEATAQVEWLGEIYTKPFLAFIAW